MLVIRHEHPAAIPEHAGSHEGPAGRALAAVGSLAGDLLEAKRARDAMARTVRWASQLGFQRVLGVLEAASGQVEAVASVGLASNRVALAAAADVGRYAGPTRPVGAARRALAAIGFVSPVAVSVRAKGRHGDPLGLLVIDLVSLRGASALAGVAAVEVAAGLLGRCLVTAGARDAAVRRVERRRRPWPSPGDPRALAGLAHELRTPLNVVVAFSQAIRAGIYGPMTPGQGRALERVGANARALDLIIEGFLAGAGAGAPGPRRIVRVDVGRAVAEAVRLARPAAAAQGRNLRLARRGKLPRIEADRAGLRLLLTALVKAALTTTVGPIRVEVCQDVTGDTISVACRGPPGPPSGAVALARCRGLAAALGAQIQATVEPARAELQVRLPRRFYPLPP